MPNLGFTVISGSISTWCPFAKLSENRCITMARIICISIKAKLLPMQSLGPPPKLAFACQESVPKAEFEHPKRAILFEKRGIGPEHLFDIVGIRHREPIRSQREVHVKDGAVLPMVVVKKVDRIDLKRPCILQDRVLSR